MTTETSNHTTTLRDTYRLARYHLISIKIPRSRAMLHETNSNHDKRKQDDGTFERLEEAPDVPHKRADGGRRAFESHRRRWTGCMSPCDSARLVSNGTYRLRQDSELLHCSLGPKPLSLDVSRAVSTKCAFPVCNRLIVPILPFAR